MRRGRLQGGFKGGRKLQGGWIQMAMGAASVGTSLMGMRSAGKEQRRAAAHARAMDERTMRLAEAENSRGQLLFDEYQQTFVPRTRELVADAFNNESSPEAAASRATTDVRAAQEAARERGLRDARRLGINPASGAYAALDNQQALHGTALEVSSRDSARRTARDDNFRRQHAALTLGGALPSQAGSFTGRAGSMMAGLSDAASRRLDQANALAGQAGASFGRAITNFATTASEGFGKPASYGTGFAPAETIRLSDAGSVNVQRPVIYEG